MSEQREHRELFVGGRWRAPHGGGAQDVIDARTGTPMGSVPLGDAADVDAAVAAARAAWPAWAATRPPERAQALRALADALEGRREEIAELIAREVGTPKRVGVAVQAGLAVTLLREAAALAEELAFEERLGSSLIVREPVGVVACITPWNFPLNQIVAKVASALAAGCTVVVKPASEAPLSAFVLAEAAERTLPAGVLNLVTGSGAVLGEALTLHPDVDMVSFTGSTDTGRRIAELAARSVKRLALELGGKSPNVILDDADVERAARDGVERAFLNAGQTCSALTRMIVPRPRLAEYEEAVVEAVRAQVLGDPLEERTTIGPLVSARQRETVRGYVAAGEREGARLLIGGAEAPAELSGGFYVRPTVFGDVANDMTIAREEIFGPVLALLAAEDEDDAVRIANDSVYGLAAGVWSGDDARALAVARRLRAGQVNVNGGAFNPRAPFGGFKQSGYGRERGPFGLEEFLEAKSLQL